MILDEQEGVELPVWTRQLRRVGYSLGRVVRCSSTRGVSIYELASHIEETGARCILIPSPRYVCDAFEPVIAFARRRGLTIRIYSPEVQRILSGAKVDDTAGVTIEAPVRQPALALQQGVKRVFDLAVSSLAIVLTAPVCVLVTIAIKLESEGPLLFRQARSASPGRREFRVIKFRSMCVDSADQRRELAKANESDGALFKMRHDPRVTRVGRIIRKLSLDELPQLVNVFRGEMSLVGPRPLPSDDFSQVTDGEIEVCYHRRSWVKPGLTGLWQTSGRNELGFAEMVMLDLYYAEHGTIFLDLWILLNTIPTVVTGRGAY